MIIKVRHYADGGKVETPKPEPKPKEPPKPDPKMLGTGALSKAATALRDRRAEQMKELGLKDGGEVKAKLPGPETRKMPPVRPLPKPQPGPKPQRLADGGPVKKPKLGSGARFKKVAAAAKKDGARDPNAVAAAVGRKKYGAKRMAAMAKAGRRR